MLCFLFTKSVLNTRNFSYFEWLKKGKERLPHFTKHANGNLMLLAGLYDRVVLEGMRILSNTGFFFRC